MRPELGEALARWWSWARSAPYQVGWERRGFRSSCPSDTLLARSETLRQLLVLAGNWPCDAAWFATWLSHLPVPGGALAGLLASEVTAGNDAVTEALLASAFGRHPVSGTTRDGLAALLGSDRPDLWEQVVVLLRAAGRQEGLRSVILEAVDLAHPSAFAALLDVVVSEDLVRFAGTVRAVGVWFGEELAARRTGQLPGLLAELARALVDPAPLARERVQPGAPEETFVRLFALAQRDAHAAVAAAADLLAGPSGGDAGPGVRRAAVRLLAELGLPQARAALRPCLADPDLAVYATAVSAWPTGPYARDRHAQLDDDDVEVLLERVRTLGAPTKVETGVVGSRLLQVGSAHAADVVLAHRPVAAAPPEALAAASADGRSGAVQGLAEDPVAHRAALFGYVTDPSSWVRSQAHRALEALPEITPAEAALLQDALRRKAGDVRRTALTLLQRQSPEAVAASVAALAAGTPEQSAAAGELEQRAGLGGAEAAGAPPPTQLPQHLRHRPEKRTPAERPVAPPGDGFARFHATCLRVVTSLRAWLSEHRDVELRTWYGEVALLADLRWLPDAAPGAPLPLEEVLGPWWERTAPEFTDGGLELALLRAALPRQDAPWAASVSARVVGPVPEDPHASALVLPVIDSLAGSRWRSSWADVVLDAFEVLFAELPLSTLAGPTATAERLGSRRVLVEPGYEVWCDGREAFAPPESVLPLETLTPGQVARLWRLARFLDEPEGALDVLDGPRVRHHELYELGSGEGRLVPDQPWRHRPGEELLCRAVEAGGGHARRPPGRPAPRRRPGAATGGPRRHHRRPRGADVAAAAGLGTHRCCHRGGRRGAGRRDWRGALAR
ncbi:HEAT repeat [Quadrisphaera granulorum]|uniref:HEAT repeat protein n=1 Tax=Quadrisphaera granulorum TaxID=317664 RepID=A0A316ADB4_9ACTN|nr:hypothetical protein [Quadrisphaera granulorum]PWJ54874.1 HEAT repeat protein [Quadrisphaera granulorum]SZE95820.1 HEAT repeat [Quadrisphaera granulorum]